MKTAFLGAEELKHGPKKFDNHNSSAVLCLDCLLNNVDNLA